MVLTHNHNEIKRFQSLKIKASFFERILSPEAIYSTDGADDLYRAHKNYQITIQEYIAANEEDIARGI